MKRSIKVVLQSFFMLFLFITVTLVTLINTTTGNKIAYFYISDKITEKARIEVKVLSLNFYQYPKFSGEFLLENEYNLDIDGILSFSTLDLDFSVTSNCISSNICRIDDDVHLTGKLYGKFRDFTIKGEGKILDGTLYFNGTKKRRSFENINLVLSDINSTKFFTALGQKPLLDGKSDLDLHLDTLSKKNTMGQLNYHAVDHNYSGQDIKVTIDTNVHIQHQKYTFTIDMSLPEAIVQIREGQYDQALKYATAKYTLDIKELANLNKITKVDATGPFYASGNLVFDKKITMLGISESFGGMLNIAYEKKKFHFDLKDIPFNTIMQRFKQNPLIDADMTGTIDYDIAQNKMHTNVKLKHVKSLQEELNDLILDKFGYDFNHEVYPDSSFEATYKEDILSSYLKIANKHNYLIFKDSKLNASERSIYTTIDFQIQQHNISGKLYARNDGYTRHTVDTYLKFDGIVEKYYTLKLTASLNKDWINMDYELSASRLPSHITTIVDDINITGQLYGPYTRLYISGKGEALDGRISFDGTKSDDTFQNINVQMKDIHAKKLYTLLGKPTLPHGKANVELYLDFFNKAHKKGTLDYTLTHGIYKTLPLDLSAHIKIEDNLYKFTAAIDLNGSKVNFTEGLHDTDDDKTHAFYTLDIKDLTTLEALFGHAYKGSFYAKGTIDYQDDFLIRGLSKSLGGTTDFLYKKAVLYVDFNDTSLKDLLNIFSYPMPLNARTYGSINYFYNKDLLLVNTKLKDTKFIQSKIVENVYKKANVYLPDEVFNNSTLELTYKNDIILGSIKLENDTGHIFLTDVRIDTDKKLVNAYFDVDIQQQAFTGKIYGPLNKPKVNLNLQKLLRHEMDKQLDSIVGKGTREMMESMPMGDMSKDVASGVGGTFMGIFF